MVEQVLAINALVLSFSNFVQVEQSAVVESSFDVDVGSDTLSVVFQKRIKDDLFVIIGFWTIPQNFVQLRDSIFLLAGRA